MRYIRFVFLIALLASPVMVVGEESLKPGDHVGIIGDSITEQLKYSTAMENYLIMCQPVANLETTQFGWSGETSWRFAERMQHDVIPFKPSVVTTCYGMNDGGYDKLSEKNAQEYRRAMTDVVRQFKKGGTRMIVVGAPGAVDTQIFKRNISAETYNTTLGQLRDIAKEVAMAEGVGFADVHQTMIDAMKAAKEKLGADYPVCGAKDGFHPDANGALLMAYAFLKGLGCNGDLGTITLDTAAGIATAADGHKVLAADKTHVEVESSRYPFCFRGGQREPDATRGIIEFCNFNQDLNRLTLVVKGVNGKAKVTWGSASKEFSGEQLEKGINLAAEFLDNPFCEPFFKVAGLVNEEQKTETALTKTLINGLTKFEKMLPEQQADFDHITQAAIKKTHDLGKTAAAAIVPVKHTIKVEVLP